MQRQCSSSVFSLLTFGSAGIRSTNSRRGSEGKAVLKSKEMSKSIGLEIILFKRPSHSSSNLIGNYFLVSSRQSFTDIFLQSLQSPFARSPFHQDFLGKRKTVFSRVVFMKLSLPLAETRKQSASQVTKQLPSNFVPPS